MKQLNAAVESAEITSYHRIDWVKGSDPYGADFSLARIAPHSIDQARMAITLATGNCRNSSCWNRICVS